MKNAKKEGAKKPTSEDYAEMIYKIDMVLRAFEDVKSKVAVEWYWWSLSIYTQKKENIKNTIERAQERTQTIWSDCKELATKCAAFTTWDIHRESFYFGGATTFENDNEFTAYFATSEAGTESEHYKIAHIAQLAVKTLRIFYLPKCGFQLSQYLDGDVVARDWHIGSLFIDISQAPWCWFEFLYNIGIEIGFPQQQCFELMTVDDFHPDYIKLAQIPHSERMEIRIHPEIRIIENDICDASIQSLKFLRLKVEQRLQSQPVNQHTHKDSEVDGVSPTDEKISKPKNPITLTVAVKNFSVSRASLLRAINDGRLKTYRPKNAPKNAQHIVDAVEVAGIWNRRN